MFQHTVSLLSVVGLSNMFLVLSHERVRAVLVVLNCSCNSVLIHTTAGTSANAMCVFVVSSGIFEAQGSFLSIGSELCREL